MGDYKYGTNYTSVKVKYAPGGASSLNLAWDEPPNPIRNSEKRHAVQDPFRSRESNRNPYEQESPNPPYKVNPGYPNQVGYKMPNNPSSSEIKQFKQENRNYEGAVIANQEHSWPNYHQNNENRPVDFPQNNYFRQADSGNYLRQPEIDFPQNNYLRQPEIDFPQNNYFRQPDSGNYSKQPESYRPEFKSPIYSQQGQYLMEKNFGKGQDVNYKEPERVAPIQEYRQEAPQVNYNYPPRYPARNEGAIDAFSNIRFPGNQGERQQNNYGVKNSVKVSNPPGGQSSIMFG